MNDHAQLVLGALTGLLLPLALWALGSALGYEVHDGEAVLVTRFGKLWKTLDRPGWHWVPDRVFPWVSSHRVSRRRDYRTIRRVAINDARGTSVVVDIFLEFRIVDPARAVFQVEDWDRALTNVASHAVTSILGNREFREILCDRTELGKLLQEDLKDETERWGIQVERTLVQKVSLLPEVSQELFRSIAARLDRSKAIVEEEGRQRAALLEAETTAEVAKLLAEARGQYPAAVGRAFAALKDSPRVLEAYQVLHALSLLHPHRVVAFQGFEGDNLRVADAGLLRASERKVETPAGRLLVPEDD